MKLMFKTALFVVLIFAVVAAVSFSSGFGGGEAREAMLAEANLFFWAEPMEDLEYTGVVDDYIEPQVSYEYDGEFQENYGYSDVYEYDYGYYEYDEECPYTVTILLSAAGDTTLGGDSRWAGYHAFMREFRESGGDHSIFLANVAHIFRESDLSVLNLEGVLTNITYPHMDKPFVFRGPTHFAQILSSSYIDVVSIANNHTIDFFERGMRDTRAALTYEGVAYFGNERSAVAAVLNQQGSGNFHRLVIVYGASVIRPHIITGFQQFIHHVY